MYHTACEVLKSAGFERYEISNFAKAGRRSRHNLKYWSMAEYIGAGLGASSYFGGVRYENPSDEEGYIEFAKNFRPLYEGKTPLSPKERMEEFMFLALRTAEGASAKSFETMFGRNMQEIFEEPIQKHVENGLLINNTERICLTDKGFDLANYVMSDFLL